MDISFIIINWNTKDLLLECLASIYQTVSKITFEIWVVDNGSSDGSVRAVKEKYPAKKCLLMSANPDDEQIARDSGADAFLAKPVSVNDLFRVVEAFVV